MSDPFAGLPPLTEAETARLWERARDVPISTTLGFEFVSIARGQCALAWNRDPRYDGIFRSMHGGLMMTLADSAAAFALLSVIEPDSRVTTTEMNIRFLAPVRDRVVAHARVLKAGRSLCPILVEVFDGNGRMVAHAGMTYMRLGKDPKEARP
jgi:uncharacterized protein (TIGR00369 family)